LNDATVNQEIQFFRRDDTGTCQYKVEDGGVVQVATTTAVASLGVSHKDAATYSANDFAVSLDGAAVGTDVAGTVPVVTTLRIGHSAAGGNFLFGTLLQLGYYPLRLSNAKLQALTV
jgi:hypothetical protein